MASVFGGGPILGSSLLSFPLPQIVRLLNSFPALLSLSSALWTLSEPASPRTLFWNALSFFALRIPQCQVLHIQNPCTQEASTHALSPLYKYDPTGLCRRLSGSAHPCYSQISFVLLLFETPLTRHCFSPASQFMSK